MKWCYKNSEFLIRRPPVERVPTGIRGLDDLTGGGFIPGRAYLVRGGPGSGKTTFGLNFLEEGLRRKEKSLFICLSEAWEKIAQDSRAQGLDLEGLSVLDLSPTSEFFAKKMAYDIFTSGDVERDPLVEKIVEEVERVSPQRVFLDSMTQFRYFTKDPYIYRKQVLSFLRFAAERGITLLFSSEASDEAPDHDLQFLADGVFTLGVDGGYRFLEISKFRGTDIPEARHTVKIGEGGLRVFPKIRPRKLKIEIPHEVIPSGIPEVDEMLSGGLEKGSTTIISGPTGVGKSTLAALFAKEAAGRGERTAIYTFEENEDSYIRRSEGLAIPVKAMISKGTLSLTYVEPTLLTCDEFGALIREEVEEKGTSIVLIDSLGGYRLSIVGEDTVTHIHALVKYLSNQGVTTIIVDEVQAVTGEFQPTREGVSYLADTIIFFRYIEIKGRVAKTIGVLKKRLSDFGKYLREVEITRYGLKVGEPLTNLRGILQGVPEFLDG
ncbi:MAG: recombinase RecA [Deltaproteobacteria bacterium]|nr:MAG: recombinase RecA [Deltaproteobacteria bacterium]